jgi:N-sulfoglucosamine sulfohydrolase
MKVQTNTTQLVLLPLVGIGMAACAPQTPTKRPNILFAIADDMSYGHTSYNGYPEVHTPAFDRIANEGVYFKNAYVSSPSSTPSRASVLTGKHGFELEEGGVLFSYLPNHFAVYPDILEENGYFTGFTGKGWWPGDLALANRTKNPAGNEFRVVRTPPTFSFGVVDMPPNWDYFENFKLFMNERPEDQPFCFWYGAIEPHRPYLEGVGAMAGKDPSKVKVPGFYPDNDAVRNDILDYLFEIDWYDLHMMKMLNYLDSIGELDNTIVVMTSDNGMPHPRAKSNLYEYGVHMPLAVRWGNNKPRVVNDFISFADFAPTFLEAAQVKVPETMSGKSFLNILKSKKSGQVDKKRNSVLTYKERHAWSHTDGKCIPTRGYRKDNWSLIWNMAPDMWPAGSPDIETSFFLWPFGDVDNGPTKDAVMSYKNKSSEVDYYQLSFGKRPEFELYDLEKDPEQLNNLAQNPEYSTILNDLLAEMKDKLLSLNDPRMTGKGIEHFQNAPYFGKKAIETGWMWPNDWNALTKQQQDSMIKQQYILIESEKKRLKTLYGED